MTSYQSLFDEINNQYLESLSSYNLLDIIVEKINNIEPITTENYSREIREDIERIITLSTNLSDLYDTLLNRIIKILKNYLGEEDLNSQFMLLRKTLNTLLDSTLLYKTKYSKIANKMSGILSKIVDEKNLKEIELRKESKTRNFKEYIKEDILTFEIHNTKLKNFFIETTENVIMKNDDKDFIELEKESEIGIAKILKLEYMPNFYTIEFESSENFIDILSIYVGLNIKGIENNLVELKQIVFAYRNYKTLYAKFRLLKYIASMKYRKNYKFKITAIKNIIENKKIKLNNPWIIYEDLTKNPLFVENENEEFIIDPRTQDIIYTEKEIEINEEELSYLRYYLNYVDKTNLRRSSKKQYKKETHPLFIKKGKTNNLWFMEFFGETHTQLELKFIDNYKASIGLIDKGIRNLSNSSYCFYTFSIDTIIFTRIKGRLVSNPQNFRETVFEKVGMLIDIYNNTELFFYALVEEVRQKSEEQRDHEPIYNEKDAPMMYLYSNIETLLAPYNSFLFKYMYLRALILLFEQMQIYSYEIVGLHRYITIVVVNNIKYDLDNIVIRGFNYIEYKKLKSLMKKHTLFTQKDDTKENCFIFVLEKFLKIKTKEIKKTKKENTKDIIKKLKESYKNRDMSEREFINFYMNYTDYNEIHYIEELKRFDNLNIGDIILGKATRGVKHCYLVIGSDGYMTASYRPIPEKYYSCFLDLECATYMWNETDQDFVEDEKISHSFNRDFRIGLMTKDNFDENVYKHIPVVYGFCLDNEKREQILGYNWIEEFFPTLDFIVENTTNHQIQNPKWLKNKSLPKYIKAYSTIFLTTYNGSAYDIILTFEQMILDKGMSIEIEETLIHNSKIINLSFYYKDRHFNITDLYKILAVGQLKHHLKFFNCEYQKKGIDFPYELINKSQYIGDLWDLLIEYLRFDVLGLRELYYKVEDAINLIIEELKIPLENKGKNKMYFLTISIHMFYSASHLSYYLGYRVIQMEGMDRKIFKPKIKMQLDFVDGGTKGARVYLNRSVDRFNANAKDRINSGLSFIYQQSFRHNEKKFNKKTCLYDEIDSFTFFPSTTYEIFEDFEFNKKKIEAKLPTITKYNSLNEIFESFDEYIVEGDFNAMYGSIMCNQDFPYGKIKYLDFSDEKDLRYFQKNIEGELMYVLLCDFDGIEDELVIPLVPFKDEKNNMEYTFQKRTNQYLCSLDYERSKEHGYQYTIKACYYWTNKGKIFQKYMKTMLELRIKYKEINASVEMMLKIIINGFFGKFIQKDKFDDCIVLNIDEIDEFEKKTGKSLGQMLDKFEIKNIRTTADSPFIVFEKINKKKVENPYASKPKQIGMFVLSGARWLLNDVYLKIGAHKKKNKDYVIYSDTDSIMCYNKTLPFIQEFIDAVMYGKLKIEHCANTSKMLVESKIIFGDWFDLKKYCYIIFTRETNKITNEVDFFIKPKMRWAGANRKRLTINHFLLARVKANENEPMLLQTNIFKRRIYSMDGKIGVYSFNLMKEFLRTQPKEIKQEYIQSMLPELIWKTYKRKIQFSKFFDKIMYDIDWDVSESSSDEGNDMINLIHQNLYMKKLKFKHQLTFADLFCGLGGFHQAIKNIKEVDSECVLACDIDKNIRKVYKLNYGLIPEDDVRQLKPEHYNRIDCVFFGFPCQSVSFAGKRLGLNDVRGTLFFDTLKLIEQWQPKFCVAENVKGIYSANNGLMYELMYEAIHEIGYMMMDFLTSSLEVGVPQHRQRVIFVIIRKDLYYQGIFLSIYNNYLNNTKNMYNFNFNKFEFDNVTDEKYNIKEDKKYFIDGWNYLIKQLSGVKISNIDLNLIGKEPIYDNAVKNKEIIKMNRLYLEYKEIIDNFYLLYPLFIDTNSGTTVKKLNWSVGIPFDENINIYDYHIHISISGIRVRGRKDLPTLTKGDCNNIILGGLYRHITPQECFRLQSFPRDYKLLKDSISYKQIGNSVNVYVIECVIRSILSNLEYEQDSSIIQLSESINSNCRLQ